MKINLLFLCTGNTCRSPLAEALMAEKIANNALTAKEVKVDSAGLMASNGNAASNFSLELAQENSLDLSSHRSKLLTDSLLSWADMILVMEQAHKIHLQNDPRAASKEIILLGQFACAQSDHPNKDIADPFGGKKSDYQACFNQIKTAIDGLTKYLA